MIKKIILKVFITFIALILFSGCTEPDAPEPRPYILSFTVTAPAGTTAVAVTIKDLKDNTDIYTSVPALPPAVVPDISGTINYNNIGLVRVIVDVTDLPASETITIEIWYEEREKFPPENSRRLIETVSHTDVTGSTPVSFYYDFALPFPDEY